jgi:hypothetical protein
MRLVLTVTIAVTVEGIRNIKSVWSKTSESEFLPDGPCFRSRDLHIQEVECEHTLATESGLASCVRDYFYTNLASWHYFFDRP